MKPQVTCFGYTHSTVLKQEEVKVTKQTWTFDTLSTSIFDSNGDHHLQSEHYVVLIKI